MILSERNLKTSGVNRKKHTLKQVGETETQSHHKPTPSMATYNQEGTHNSQLPPNK